VPDPRSRWQPDGVHGLSRLYDTQAYEWGDAAWTGRQLAGSVVYELHVGTFTPEGTFAAAAGRLDHLVELGVDLVELLPVNAVNGTRNWGYDGVDWYAVHEPYGGPDGLKAFVDACHRRGLGVVLDVVYNHLGPSGAYLPRFGPFLKPGRSTWGELVNLDGPGSGPVRRHILDSALMWLHEYHVDGLRLDAVHALVDLGATHLLEQLAIEVDALSAHLRRPLTLIAESDLNDPRLIRSRDAGGYGLTAQWDDDIHHALHALLTGEGQGYYGDFAAAPFEALERTLTGAFFHAGTLSTFRGSVWGRPVDRARVPGWRFLGYSQTHDQVGNRAVGDRLASGLSPGLARVAAALVLTSPFTPMLFMGEEWAASTPWQYFTSHEEPKLAEAVREGRRREFAAHGWAAEDVPDPQASSTVVASTLDWSESVSAGTHSEMLDWYRSLIALRRAEPWLSDPRLDLVSVAYDSVARWVVVTRGPLRVVVNLAADAQAVPLGGDVLGLLLSSDPDLVVGAGPSIDVPPESVAFVRLAAS